VSLAVWSVNEFLRDDATLDSLMDVDDIYPEYEPKEHGTPYIVYAVSENVARDTHWWRRDEVGYTIKAADYVACNLIARRIQQILGMEGTGVIPPRSYDPATLEFDVDGDEQVVVHANWQLSNIPLPPTEEGGLVGVFVSFAIVYSDSALI
jgi:hypothetical protein